MVGEPYHGGDFMTLTQRAKDQRVQMTEEIVLGGGTMGHPDFRKETPQKVELILLFFCKKKVARKRWYV